VSRSSRRDFVDRVEKKVWDLRGSGLRDRHLRLGVLSVMEQGLPLRDSIVLREARQAEERETPAARDAWEAARAAIKRAVPESTFAIWIEPIEVLGEEDELLLLNAPTGIRAWCERRYAGLIGEAIRTETDFAGAAFGGITLPELERVA
jgi:hypothetical protein